MHRASIVTWCGLALLLGAQNSLAQMMNAGGTRPAVSPDGQYIAFNSARDGTWDVYVGRSDGAQEHRISDFAETNFVNLGPSTWIGNQVFVWRRVSDTTRIVVLDKDGHPSTLAPQPKVPEDATQIRPSPDGQRLVFVHGDRRRPRLAISNLDGSGLRDLAPGTLAVNPDWSRDGKQIVFTLIDSASHGQIAVVSADGGGYRVVTHVDPADGLPLWASLSPDGKRLVFQIGKYNRTKIEESTAHLWVADVASGDARKLMPHDKPSLDETPTWFPDGRRIAFQSNRTGMLQIWTVNPDGTDPRQITHWQSDGEK